MSIVIEKRCTKCGKIKPINSFCRHKSCKNGLSPVCNSCKKQYREQNKEYLKEYFKDYRSKNRDKRNFNSRLSTAKRKGAIGKFSYEQWKTLCQFYENRCLCCGSLFVKLTIDHVVPISCGGKSIISNIQPLCRKCNIIKSDKTIDYRPDRGEFARILQINSL